MPMKRSNDSALRGTRDNQIIALEGSGEDYYYSTWYANPSDNRMKSFVTTAMDAISDFDVSALDTSAADIRSVVISPSDGVESTPGARACSLPQLWKQDRRTRTM